MCWWLSPRPTPRTGGGLQLTGVGEGRGGGSACPLLRTDPPQRTRGPWLPQAAAPCPPDLGPRWGSVAGTHARVWHVWWPHTWGGVAHGGIQTRSHSVCLTERRCWARPAEVISRSWVSEPLSSPSPDSSPDPPPPSPRKPLLDLQGGSPPPTPPEPQLHPPGVPSLKPAGIRPPWPRHERPGREEHWAQDPVPSSSPPRCLPFRSCGRGEGKRPGGPGQPAPHPPVSSHVCRMGKPCGATLWSGSGSLCC